MKLSKLRASTSMRHVAGRSIPRQDTTSFGMRHALKRANGGACIGAVEGEPKRASLAKATMRRASGGPVKRWPGGVTEDEGDRSANRISEDSKQKAASARKQAQEKDDKILPDTASGFLPIALGAAIHGLSRGRLGRATGRILGGAGAVGGTASGAADLLEAVQLRNKASSIERGEAEPGKEDRKSGGRVKRADGGLVPPQDRHPPGELANVEQNKYLKEQAAKEPLSVGNPNALAVGAGAAGLFKAVTARHPVGKVIGALIGAGGASRAPALGRDYRQMAKSIHAKHESEKFDKAEQEDRDEAAGRKDGGPLNAKRRNALADKSFAGPDRSYPINDANHARNALARVSNKSPELKARVRAAVHRKYPGIGKD